MNKLGAAVKTLTEDEVQKKEDFQEDEIKRECQLLWKTLCEADPNENMFSSNAYNKFMGGCVSKLRRI